MSRVLILHNEVADDASPADSDVLVQVRAVEDACRLLGHVVERLACTLNLNAVRNSVAQFRPDVVFQLVESLGGSDRLASLIPALLETLRVPFTGSSAASLDATNCKPIAKNRLRLHALPTPLWLTCNEGAKRLPAGRYITKASWEHASVGLDDDALSDVTTTEQLRAAIAERSHRFPTGCFAEQFIAGREFNLSLLAGPDGPQALPLAEIDFSDFPVSKPQIVGFAAKWSEQSFEFAHTPRRFVTDNVDRALRRQLEQLALSCWRLFNLRGYARVDFRVDSSGQPYILEINTNPCLSPDAGFAAALTKAGIDFASAVQRIIDDASTSHDVRRVSPSPARTIREQPFAFRTNVLPTDAAAVRRIVAATDKFRPAEIDVAVELVDERLAKGAASGYDFVFAEHLGQVVGYACFGKIEVTESSYDLYWIAVDPQQQGAGLGKQLMAAVEQSIRAAGGTRMYIETSGRPDYLPSRAFYDACGCTLAALVADFYAPGDDKAIYVRELM